MAKKKTTSLVDALRDVASEATASDVSADVDVDAQRAQDARVVACRRRAHVSCLSDAANSTSGAHTVDADSLGKCANRSARNLNVKQNRFDRIEQKIESNVKPVDNDATD